ncbi:DUF1559 family PulG-like putative transporter [Blastopirellula retiformator]|uniref:DUF1559 domain-containing protein n=1 Tax=Blastopirellula retiformator TaxID=2527970 RepID=A0A5C5V0R3_9BACT|nr:DUF1559 domain-containing protein [Blastopirellula retiformator]TWT32028.1 hypothetical protein Enr8_39540 [Blastopirellula retiformator]
MALAAHIYHDVNQALPPAGFGENSTAEGWGRKASWLVRIMPALELSAAADSSFFINSSFDMMNASWAAPARHWQAAAQLRAPVFNCPSSPLPTTRKYATNGPTQALGAPAEIEVQITDYASNGGCAFVGGTVGDWNPRAFWDYSGINCDNGVIPMILRDYPPPQFQGSIVGFQDITDGTSNTAMFGEQSDFHEGNPDNEKDSRASHVTGGLWSCSTGTSSSTISNHVVTYFAINYPGNSWWSQGGWWGNSATWINTAYRSAHPGGVQFVFCDGSVHFISETVDHKPDEFVDNNVLENLANRHDGFVVDQF